MPTTQIAYTFNRRKQDLLIKRIHPVTFKEIKMLRDNCKTANAASVDGVTWNSRVQTNDMPATQN